MYFEWKGLGESFKGLLNKLDIDEIIRGSEMILQCCVLFQEKYELIKLG